MNTIQMLYKLHCGSLQRNDRKTRLILPAQSRLLVAKVREVLCHEPHLALTLFSAVAGSHIYEVSDLGTYY